MKNLSTYAKWLILFVFIIHNGFNYVLTHAALVKLFGPLAIWGISWAVIYAITFCTMDLLWIGRLFPHITPYMSNNKERMLDILWTIAALLNAVLVYYAFIDRYGDANLMVELTKTVIFTLTRFAYAFCTNLIRKQH